MPEMDIETDFVAIGSGAAGTVAALTVAEGGARVVVLEKMRSLGGSSNFPEGMFAVGSDLQRRQYVGYSRDDAFRRIMEYSHWRANARLARAFVDETAGAIDWLQGHGVEFEGISALVPDAPMVWHVLKGPEDGRASVMMKALALAARQRGVDFLLGTKALELIKEGGKVTGILTEQEGREVRVRAKAVLVATGGYANNKEWIRRYTGFDVGVNLIALGNVEKLGEGIRMAWQAGAAEEGLGVLQVGRAGPMLTATTNFLGPVETVALQPGLWVNQEGERYCDESIQTNFPLDANAMMRQRGRYVYAVFDESNVRHWMEHGLDIARGLVHRPGARLDISGALKRALADGAQDLWAAPSVVELAPKIGIDPAVLKATVEEYNGFCAKGHDDLFGKDRRYLRPLREPAYYALKCNMFFLGTLGGIKVNHRMEAVDRKDNPIPGLYAGGLDAGGLYGDSYDVAICGGTLAFAVNSGRIAGKNILRYLGKEAV